MLESPAAQIQALAALQEPLADDAQMSLEPADADAEAPDAGGEVPATAEPDDEIETSDERRDPT